MNRIQIKNMAREVVMKYFNMALPYVLDQNNVSQYRGRLIFHNKWDSMEFIKLIDWLNIEFGLTGADVAKIVIEEYGIEELKREM